MPPSDAMAVAFTTNGGMDVVIISGDKGLVLNKEEEESGTTSGAVSSTGRAAASLSSSSVEEGVFRLRNRRFI